MNNEDKILIFDFDGTVADSIGELIKMLEEISGSKIEGKEIISSDDLLNNLTKGKPKFLTYYAVWRARKIFARKLNIIRFAPQMKEISEKLHQQDIKMGILTSNSKKNIKNFLKREGVGYFDFIFSSGFFGKKKALEKICRIYDFDKKNVFYIGDETRDIWAAKGAGIKSVAVGWGFDKRNVLEKENPDYFAGDPRDLLEIIKNHK